MLMPPHADMLLYAPRFDADMLLQMRAAGHTSRLRTYAIYAARTG